MPEDEWSLDFALFPRSARGVLLCLEPCGLRGSCRLGIAVERLEPDGSAHFEIECPADHRETPDLAHGTWTAAIMSEMSGHLPLLMEEVAFLGTLTVRFQQPVPMGEQLIGRATLEGRERRKLFVDTVLLSTTGMELAKASAIMITAQAPPTA